MKRISRDVQLQVLRARITELRKAAARHAGSQAEEPLKDEAIVMQSVLELVEGLPDDEAPPAAGAAQQ